MNEKKGNLSVHMALAYEHLNDCALFPKLQSKATEARISNRANESKTGVTRSLCVLTSLQLIFVSI